MTVSRHIIRPVPVAPVAPSKMRILATLTEIYRLVDALPETACRVLEESRLIGAARAHVLTLGQAASVLEPVMAGVRNIGNAVQAGADIAAALRRVRRR